MTTTRQDLKERVDAIPDAIDSALRGPHPELPEQLLRCSGFDVCGLGASAGPAAMTSEVLNDLGLPSLVRAPSSFMTAPKREPEEKGLVIFSQGLSPNARLALVRAREYAASILFTAVSAASSEERREVLQVAKDAGTFVWHHEPPSEPGSLLRLLGPACATAAGLAFAEQLAARTGRPSPSYLSQLEHLPVLLGRIATDPQAHLAPDEDPLAWLVIGESTAIFHPLAWKWQEALYTPLCPTFDLLSFAHGPLQALLQRAGPLVVLHRDTARDHELLSRLGKVLDPSRHRIVPLVAEMPGPLRIFEDEAVVHQWILRAMEGRGITPGEWPGRGQDGPLYDLGK